MHLDLLECDICGTHHLQDEIQICDVCGRKICLNCCDEENGEVICDYCKGD